MEQPHLKARLASGAFDTDALHVRRLKGREAISTPFTFEVDVRTAAGHELPEGCVPGAPIEILLERAGDPTPPRHVRGLVDRVDEHFGAVHGRRAYTIHVVPSFSRLELTRTQEVMVDVSVPDVVRQKLELHQLQGQFELRLDQNYGARETVVQFDESDLDFLSRLTEHLGISFFFESDEDGTKVVFTDHAAGFGTSSRSEPLPFQEGGGGEHVTALRRSRRRAPGSVFVQDHNYRSPLVELTGAHDVQLGLSGGIVEYGAHHKTPEEGARLARVRAEQCTHRALSFEGASTVAALEAGHRTRIAGHAEDPAELLITSVTHEGSWPFADEPNAGPATYSNTFEAVQSSPTFRPELRTRRPRIHGFVTGVVKGSEGTGDGGIPFLDEHGRYLVELQFDTLRPPHKTRASHRIRMAQPFAGPNHGMHFPLRPGAEVIVGFLDGDPERPVILGSVPNAIAPSPVNHTNPHKSVISTANGGIVIELGDHPF